MFIIRLHDIANEVEPLRVGKYSGDSAILA